MWILGYFYPSKMFARFFVCFFFGVGHGSKFPQISSLRMVGFLHVIHKSLIGFAYMYPFYSRVCMMCIKVRVASIWYYWPCMRGLMMPCCFCRADFWFAMIWGTHVFLCWSYLLCFMLQASRQWDMQLQMKPTMKRVMINKFLLQCDLHKFVHQQVLILKMVLFLLPYSSSFYHIWCF